jgi:hypothetical protein
MQQRWYGKEPQKHGVRSADERGYRKRDTERGIPMRRGVDAGEAGGTGKIPARRDVDTPARREG